MALEVEKKGLSVGKDSVGKDLDDSLEFKYEAKPVYSFFKRMFDIVVSFICIVFLLIPFAVISLIILIEDKEAPPIFVQKRVGKIPHNVCEC